MATGRKDTVPDKEKMLMRMTRLCAGRECCRSEILAKLSSLEPSDRDEILSKLCSEGYVDDARYARAFARDKSSLQGWGNLKITLALQRKSISPEAIAAALSEIDKGAADAKMEQMLRSKWRSLAGEADPRRKEAKLLRYALGRGWEYEKIKKIYDNIRRD